MFLFQADEVTKCLCLSHNVRQAGIQIIKSVSVYVPAGHLSSLNTATLNFKDRLHALAQDQ